MDLLLSEKKIEYDIIYDMTYTFDWLYTLSAVFTFVQKALFIHFAFKHIYAYERSSVLVFPKSKIYF